MLNFKKISTDFFEVMDMLLILIHENYLTGIVLMGKGMSLDDFSEILNIAEMPIKIYATISEIYEVLRISICCVQAGKKKTSCIN